MDWISPALQLKKHTVLQATIHPDIKRTLVFECQSVLV